MTGFADGFATGYGLVDRTLTERESAELRRQQLDQQDRQSHDALARQINSDAVQNTQFDKRIGLDQSRNESQEKYQQGSLDLQRQQHENQNNQFDKRIGLDNRKLGIEENIANAVITDKQTDNERENKKLGLEELKTKSVARTNDYTQKREQAKFEQEQRQIAAKNGLKFLNNFYDPNTGAFNPPTDPKNAEKLRQSVIDYSGIDPVDVYNNESQYHKSIADVQESFDSHVGETLDDPKSIGSVNTLFGGLIRTGIGEKVEGKGEVIDKQAHSILPHKVTPTKDNPSGIVYTIAVQTKYKKDGKEVVDNPGPMTELRSNDREVDPNIKTFTADQLFKATNALSATVDFISTHPQLRASLKQASKVAGEKSDKEIVYTQKLGPDGITLTKEPDAVFDKSDGSVSKYNKPVETETEKSTFDQLKAKYPDASDEDINNVLKEIRSNAK
jgi:hypothetical protein